MLLDQYRDVKQDWELERSNQREDLSNCVLERGAGGSVTSGSIHTIGRVIGAEALETQRAGLDALAKGRVPP